MVRDVRFVGAAVCFSIVAVSIGTIAADGHQPSVDHASLSLAEQWLQFSQHHSFACHHQYILLFDVGILPREGERGAPVRRRAARTLDARRKRADRRNETIAPGSRSV
jgi:hypothetical protein